MLTRTAPKESPSDFLSQKRIVQDLLCDMHKEKDEKDLAIITGVSKRFSESRLKSRERVGISSDIDSTNEYVNGRDFLNPSDPVEQRNTGFSSGHVRSMMELDTFGPSHSMNVELKRSKGLIPQSPNIDKNRLLVLEQERLKFEKSVDLMSKPLKNDFVPDDYFERAASHKDTRNGISNELSYIFKDPRSRRTHWFETYESKIKVISHLFKV